MGMVWAGRVALPGEFQVVLPGCGGGATAEYQREASVFFLTCKGRGQTPALLEIMDCPAPAAAHLAVSPVFPAVIRSSQLASFLVPPGTVVRWNGPGLSPC